MFTHVFVGLLLVAATMVVHGVGLSLWLRVLLRHRHRVTRVVTAFMALHSTVAVLTLLHVAETALWTIVYVQLADPALPTVEDAAYFSIVTFTTLGYGDIVLARPWRLLAGFQAMAGLLSFGWSTAMLFALIGRVWQTILMSEESS